MSEFQVLAFYSGILFIIFTGVLICSSYRRAIKRRLAPEE